MLILKYTNIGRRLICAIRDASRIQLARLSKNLFSIKKFTFFSYIQFRYLNIFIFYNTSSPFSFIYFFLNIVFSCSVEDDDLFERKKILRE
jgi:hypothetical protein